MKNGENNEVDAENFEDDVVEMEENIEGEVEDEVVDDENNESSLDEMLGSIE